MVDDFRVPEELYGIIGYPLGHSLSPRLHNWAFARYGLSKIYLKWPLSDADFPAFMLSMRTMPIHGLSITIPYKQKVIPYLDGLSSQALDTGAVNTLYWSNGLLYGENTDCSGLVAPLKELDLELKSALILGAGGACRSGIVGLKNMGVSKIWICARKLQKAKQLADDFFVDVLPWDERDMLKADLLLNATPLGMSGEHAQKSAFSEVRQLSSFKVVYDLIYNPLVTPVLQLAQEAGCQTIDGLNMFLQQAAEQFKLWTNKDLDLEQARSLLLTFLSVHKP